MKTKIAFPLMIATIILQACTTQKNSIYWVSGTKVDCVGAGPQECLLVNKSEDLENAKWENFYSPIEGFEFEDGYLKKIEVKTEKLDPAKVPADVSSIRYTMVKELEKMLDYKTVLSGDWTLAKINDGPIDKSIVLPILQMNLTKMLASGSGGCNRYTGGIVSLTGSSITFGNMATTKMACINKNIEDDFLKALGLVKTYQIKGDHLTFFGENSEKLLTFIKNETVQTNESISGSWSAARINGGPINKMVTIPTMALRLKEKKITGNDGCNSYFGEITEVTETKMIFGNMGATEMHCRQMEVPDAFTKALTETFTYKFDGSLLTFYDANGKEILAFYKNE